MWQSVLVQTLLSERISNTGLLYGSDEKDRIIREARAKRGQLRYGSHPVLIFEDYPPEIVEQRKKYSEVMATLYKLGCKPALHFPARLTVRLNGVEGRLRICAHPYTLAL
ncbi:hypothetical protein AAFF_G00038910 [Aldrovandia affinis]|uniref:Uncharacterized protein n=1 Tax=Aldrovandia affinis TaxID=143900 RepID=A0AAD7X0A2_9TELE|nr:hypothetical protein AAFF_G00038910 [Aldrovandia affinis]